MCVCVKVSTLTTTDVPSHTCALAQSAVNYTEQTYHCSVSL